MEALDTDIVIAGAGIVGVALARALAMRGREVMVIEPAAKPGTITSSRNSEVVHAGLYYPPGSLKAIFCVAGRHMLEHYAAHRGIEYKQCGKLVVATDIDQVPGLAKLACNAWDNGVEKIELLTPKAAREIEPNVHCFGALHVPVSGMIDSHQLILSLQGDAENAGASFSFHTRVVGARANGRGVTLDISEGGDIVAAYRLRCGTFINAAGLWAQDVARGFEGLNPKKIPRQELGKGNYFKLASGVPRPFAEKLIYPLPIPGSSGLHVRIDFDGQTIFGPDFQRVPGIDFRPDEGRIPIFEKIIRGYWEGLPAGALEPYYSGIRPKVVLRAGDPRAGDFIIDGPRQHGVPGLYNLFGIESPGLTAAMALAECLAEAVCVSLSRGRIRSRIMASNPLLSDIHLALA